MKQIIVTSKLNTLRWLYPNTVIISNVFQYSQALETTLTKHNIPYRVRQLGLPNNN